MTNIVNILKTVAHKLDTEVNAALIIIALIILGAFAWRVVAHFVPSLVGVGSVLDNDVVLGVSILVIVGIALAEQAGLLEVHRH